MIIFDAINKKTRKEISEKIDKELDIYDVKRLAGLEKYYCKYLGPYGIGRQILGYAGIGEEYRLTCPIEHGAYTNNSSVVGFEASSASGAIITFSNYRKECIERITEKRAIPIGPYIVYASDYRDSNYISELKRVNGRTLLVMFTHGLQGVSANYNEGEFINEIKRVSVDFDTVLVSAHFIDYLNGDCKIYEDAGFKLVSAGNNNSPEFLSRMKLIFQISDAVIANSFTTGLCYAVAMEKPVYLYRQKVTLTNETHNSYFTMHHEDKEFLESLYSVCDSSKFDKYERQKEWGSYMIGLDCIRTPNEMSDLLRAYTRRSR